MGQKMLTLAALLLIALGCSPEKKAPAKETEEKMQENVVPPKAEQNMDQQQKHVQEKTKEYYQETDDPMQQDMDQKKEQMQDQMKEHMQKMDEAKQQDMDQQKKQLQEHKIDASDSEDQDSYDQSDSDSDSDEKNNGYY